MKNLIDQIISFEEGNLSFDECLDLFSALIKSGQAWQLQGCYGRTANALIEEGYLTKEGEITFYEEIMNEL